MAAHETGHSRHGLHTSQNQKELKRYGAASPTQLCDIRHMRRGDALLAARVRKHLVDLGCRLAALRLQVDAVELFGRHMRRHGAPRDG